MQLSDKIRIIRKARGFSQEGLGLNLSKVNKDGISRQTVSDWENGKSEPILDNIRDLAKVLDVSFDALLDDNIDLEDKTTLNSVLKHLSDETKEKVNNSFRYRIFAYTVKKSDYIKVGVYFFILLLSLVTALIGVLLIDRFEGAGWIIYAGGLLFFLLILMLSIPISQIRRIKRGGGYSSFGTLSQTHLVIIGWSNEQFDRTIYIPVGQVEKMELCKDATKKHGKIMIYVNGRTKPIETAEITNPEKLIYVFNNLDSYVSDPNE